MAGNDAVENILAHVLAIQPYRAEVMIRGRSGDFQVRIVNEEWTAIGLDETLLGAVRRAASNYEQGVAREVSKNGR